MPISSKPTLLNSLQNYEKIFCCLWHPIKILVCRFAGFRLLPYPTLLFSGLLPLSFRKLSFMKKVLQKFPPAVTKLVHSLFPCGFMWLPTPHFPLLIFNSCLSPLQACGLVHSPDGQQEVEHVFELLHSMEAMGSSSEDEWMYKCALVPAPSERRSLVSLSVRPDGVQRRPCFCCPETHEEDLTLKFVFLVQFLWKSELSCCMVLCPAYKQKNWPIFLVNWNPKFSLTSKVHFCFFSMQQAFHHHHLRVATFGRP